MLRYFLYKLIFIFLAIPLFVLCWYSSYGWIFLIVFLLLFLTGLILGSINICSCFYIDVICRGDADSNSVGLSFDDGPGEQTGIVLDVLKKHGVKAGFFCIGKNAQLKPELIRRIDSEGHFIGNHSFSHAFWFDLFSKKKMIQEMRETNNTIFEIIGKRMKLFRPPYGVTTPVLARAIRELNLIPMGWSVRTMDTTANGSIEKISRRLKKVKAGDIILFHDHSKGLPEILDNFISNLKSQKINLVRPDELVKIQAYE